MSWLPATQVSAVGTPRWSSSQTAEPAAVSTRSAPAISSGSRSVGAITSIGPPPPECPASNGTGLTTVPAKGRPVAMSARVQAGATPALSVPPKKHSTRGTRPRRGAGRSSRLSRRTLSRSST